MKKFFGYKKDLGDHRDFKFNFELKATLPEKVDMRSMCPPVYDQGSLGSCTAQAASGAVQTLMPKQPGEDFLPSRLFLYYNTRVIEGTVKEDSGATLRNTIKAAAKTGICTEGSWPYSVVKFAKKPTKSCYSFAKKNVIDRYERVNQSLTAIKTALAQGFPVVFGFSVYESLMTDKVAKSGDIPYPKQSESLLGGHAVLIVGYDEKAKKFIIRNSWSKNWGINGYAYIGYDYVLNQELSGDFWIVRTV